MINPLARRVIDLPADDQSHIARWLWYLNDTRLRTLASLEGISPAELDWQRPIGNSIGSLIYHLALIEADYLFVDILGLSEDAIPADIVALLPHPHRDANGDLTQVTGVSLTEHLARLETIRERLATTISGLSPEDLDRPRYIEQVGYETSPAWVVHHLMQHEAEHRGEINLLRSLAGKAAERPFTPRDTQGPG